MLRAITTRLLLAATLLWPCTAVVAAPAAPDATNRPPAGPVGCPAQVAARQHLYLPSLRLNGIAAVSTSDVWATGDVSVTTDLTGTRVPLVEHYDGHAWCAVDARTAAGRQALVGTSVEWTAGSAGQPWNEHAWAAIAAVPPPTAFGLPDLGWPAASSPENLWRTGSTSDVAQLVERWDGRRWHLVPGYGLAGGYAGLYLGPLATLSVRDTWLLGWAGASIPPILHWDGRQWHGVPVAWPEQPGLDELLGQEQCMGTAVNLDLEVMTAVSASDVWISGFFEGSVDSGPGACPVLFHWDGTTMHVVGVPVALQHVQLFAWGPISWFIGALAAVGPRDVWAIGQADSGSLALHWDGQRWQVVAQTILDIGRLSAPSSTDVWAVATGPANPWNAWHWDGSRWRLVSAVPAG